MKDLTLTAPRSLSCKSASPLKVRLNSKIKKMKSKALDLTTTQKLSPIIESDFSEDFTQIDTNKLAFELKKTLSTSSSTTVNCMDQFLEKLSSFKVPFNLLLAVLEALKPFILSDQG